MVAHATRVSPFGRKQFQHGQKEIRNLLCILNGKVILLPKNIRKSPVTQTVDVAQFTPPVEDFLRPLAGLAEGLREGTEELDDLRNMIVVFSVFGARLRVEKVVTSDEFENLEQLDMHQSPVKSRLTIAAMLQTSVLAPHLAPRITSGERYCLV